MQRRKFIAGFGSLAAAGAAGIGTGAFTSVSANRSVSVQVADDSNALLGLVPGDTGLVVANDGELEINLDGTGTAASGVNFNAVTTIGSHDNPADDHAFKVVNQGTQALMFKMNYYFSNTDWLDGNGQGKSHLTFTVYDAGGSDGRQGSTSRDYPDQRGYNRDWSLANPTGSGFGDNSGTYKFDVGEEYYLVLTVDTTGPNASMDDDLSGTAVLKPAVSTSSDSWYPENPPN